MTHPLDRRSFLWQSGGGLGGIALSWLLGQDRLLAAGPPAKDDRNGGLHHRAKAKRVVQLFMSGAASQCDLFDYKPLLIKKHGEKFDPGGKVELFQSSPGACMKSPWGWKQYGRCGRWVSDLMPHLGSCADDMAFLHAMVSKSNVHGPASYLQNTGFILPGFPCMGSWISYGLGSLSRNLPAFVVLPDPAGLPYNNAGNFSPGFLPAAHQGVVIRPSAPVPIANLRPPASATPGSESEGLSLVQSMNRDHLRDPVFRPHVPHRPWERAAAEERAARRARPSAASARRRWTSETLRSSAEPPTCRFQQTRRGV